MSRILLFTLSQILVSTIAMAAPEMPIAPSTARTVPQTAPSFLPGSDATRLPVRSDTLDFGFYQTIGGQVYAVQGESWTWDHGAADPLEGWWAHDWAPGVFFRRISQALWAADPLNPPLAPILAGSGSVWIGLFGTQARDSCWVGGVGYGNCWHQRLVGPWLTYAGSGDVNLSMKYFNDTELDFDYTRIMLESGTGGILALNGAGFNHHIGTPPSGPWAVYNRTITNAELGGGSLQRQFRIWFDFRSDTAVSDQDGGHLTSYGGFGVDDISLQGNLVGGDVQYGFESDLQGWTSEDALAPTLDLFGVAPGSDYYLPSQCSLAGNVVEFDWDDKSYPDDQYTSAWSPPVDLSGISGVVDQIFVDFDYYGVLPLDDGRFFRVRWQYYPYTCPVTGQPRWSDSVGENTLQYGNYTYCRSVRKIATDWGVPADCQLVRVGLQVTTCLGAIRDPLCEPFGESFGPVFDNVRIRTVVRQTFRITASAGTGGVISPDGAVVVNPGEDQSFTITPDSCHDVADVVVDNVSQGPLAAYTFTNVQANHTIAAMFVLKTFTITASAGTGGTISPKDAIVVNCGADQGFSITPDPGFRIADVVVDNVSRGPLATYAFANVQDTHTIAATFEAIPTVVNAVGPTGDYASLTAAFADINALGLGGPLALELQSTYVSTVETFPLTAGLFPGSGPDNTVTIRPESGATGLSITSDNATGTFDLNGATYVVIDGRPGGTGTARELTIENTNVTGWALRFINDARHNLVEYAVVRGVATSMGNGVVVFGTTTGATGNDDNTIDQCDLRDGATTPTNIVYSSGTAGKENSGNVVSGCAIYNFFNAAGTHAGISLSSGNQDWTIRENSFYETAARNMTGSGTLEWQAVASSSSLTNNLQILGNHIGGTAPQCGGGPLTYTGNATLRTLRLTVGTTAPTSVQGNVFRNISITSSSASSSQSMIGLVSGSFNVGTETPNEIGRQDAMGSIAFTLSNTGTAAFAAILAGTGTPGTIVIANNLIGGISVANVSGVGSAPVRGINAGGGLGNYSITNNTIGSPNVASSFTSSTNAAMTGIYSTSSSSMNLISGNIVANLAYLGTGTGAAQLFGISSPGSSGGTFAITGNTVHDLSSSSASISSGTTASIIGISLTASTTAGQSVTRNTVYSLSNSTPTAAACVTGIHYSGPTTGTNVVARNLVHSLSLVTSGYNSTPGVSQICGINVNGGSTSFLNNMVRLGLDANGNSVTGGYSIGGITEGVGTDSFLGNSVYVGGSGVASDQSTFALQSAVSVNSRSYRDNILVNARSNASGAGKNYAVRYSAIDGGLSSDNNDFYASGVGGVLGGTGSGALIVNYADLAAWQAGTGRDGSSISSNPLFVNASGSALTGDLHIDTTVYPVSPVTNAGVPNGTLTEDFDGELRGPAPDIGADEYANYTLAASAGPNGVIDPTGTILVNGGTDFTFTITPDPDYEVAEVLVDGNSVGPVLSYAFTDIQSNHTIAASFKLVTYTLTTSVIGGGFLTRVPDLPEYAYGDTVGVTAQALPGWQFDHWAGDAGGNDNPLTLLMTSDLAITAVFVDIAPPVVEVTSPNGGEAWDVGTTQTITWTATDNAAVTAVDLDYSTDGGATFPMVIATGQANTGSYPWLVPDTPSTTARVRATARDAADHAAADVSDADFEIHGGESAVAEALLGEHDVLGVYPNPSAGGIHVAFRAAASGFVRLSVYDVAGRLVRTLLADQVTGGVRSQVWDERDAKGAPVPTGIYLVRLEGGPGTSAVKRFVVAR